MVYLQQRDDPEAQAEAARILYPVCGTYAGRATGNLLTAYSRPWYWAGLAGGHVTGCVEADRILSEAAAAKLQQPQ